jgi:hypothetical protein
MKKGPMVVSQRLVGVGHTCRVCKLRNLLQERENLLEPYIIGESVF